MPSSMCASSGLSHILVVKTFEPHNVLTNVVRPVPEAPIWWIEVGIWKSMAIRSLMRTYQQPSRWTGIPSWRSFGDLPISKLILVYGDGKKTQTLVPTRAWDIWYCKWKKSRCRSSIVWVLYYPVLLFVLQGTRRSCHHQPTVPAGLTSITITTGITLLCSFAKVGL